ncbi:uncharacterized protein BDW70DRAFT_143595 [Aspergillus foveolatus]|uniref:uncharacterized protein n=1 Tax=Aspergillus foveolatus TaxID=210207 RepID=UPI003CCE532D
MRTLVRLLLCTAFASTALAQSQGESDDSDGASYSEFESDSSDSTTGYIYIERPTQGELVPTDAFTLEWSYDFDYTGDFTVELLPMGATAMDNSVFSTTVFALDGSTVLPGSVLPSIQPSQSAAFSVWVYTDDEYGGYGTYVDQVLLKGVATAIEASTTATHTVEVEATPTAETVGEEGIVQTQQSDGDDGLSTGAKAGIGVGVGAGALILVAIIGFFLYRRRRRPENQPSKTIREISTIGPGSVFAEFANANANGGVAAVYTGNAHASELHADSDTRPASLPVRSPLSDAGSNSVSGMGSVSARHSGERERERYELGG